MAAGDRFQVQFQRSGGLAGLGIEAAVDSARLSESEADELRELLDHADLGASVTPPRGADRFQYDVTVHRGGKVHRATAYDGSMPDELKALVNWLLAYARRQRSQQS